MLLLLSSIIVTLIVRPVWGQQQQQQLQCSDAIQSCALEVEGLESELIAARVNAFRQCSASAACHEIYSEVGHCFGLALLSVRRPALQEEDRLGFGTIAAHSRSAIDMCFAPTRIPPRKPKHAAFFVDEDAVYARAVYGVELVDDLWSLDSAVSKSTLDSKAACGRRVSLHTFGVDPATAASSSPYFPHGAACVLEAEERRCYTARLAQDVQYQQLLYQRDTALRVCIQRVRANTPCRSWDASRLRSCLCSTRESMDVYMRDSFVRCVTASLWSKYHHSNATAQQMSRDFQQRYQQQQQQQQQQQLPAPPRLPVEQHYDPLQEQQKPEERAVRGRADERHKDYMYGGGIGSNPWSSGGYRMPPSSLYYPNDRWAGQGSHLVEGSFMNGRCVCSCPSAAASSSIVPLPEYAIGRMSASPNIFNTPTLYTAPHNPFSMRFGFADRGMFMGGRLGDDPASAAREEFIQAPSPQQQQQQQQYDSDQPTSASTSSTTESTATTADATSTATEQSSDQQ